MCDVLKDYTARPDIFDNPVKTVLPHPASKTGWGKTMRRTVDGSGGCWGDGVTRVPGGMGGGGGPGGEGSLPHVPPHNT